MKFCSEELWESLARADETATFFQTPAWHRIAARHFKAESAPLLFEFPDGPACLPLLRDTRWGRWRYFSPFGTYTSVVCPRALGPEDIGVIETALKPLSIQLASSPFTRNPVGVGKMIPARVQVLELTGMDPENPMRDWSPDPRRKVRMAREGSVRIRIADSEADWHAYHAVYEKSLKRWGARASSAYPESLFERLRGLPADAMKLWLAEHEGRTIAGYVAFYHNRHACIWHGASDPEFFRLGAVQLLYHDMSAHAANAGYPVFDLLGSGGNDSLEAFKASLGAQVREYKSFLNRSGIVGRLAGLRDVLRAK
jgi:CelD/BcsL family acetyltransferase involved in cellulose biosynthesis